MSRFLARLLPIGGLVAAVLAMAIGVAPASAVPNDVTADNVIGQSGSFLTQGAGLTSTTLHYPSGVAVDSAGNVYVADTYNNRVLEYDSPLTTDFIADRVFGQGGSFTSGVCNLGGISASSLCQPVDVAVDAARNLYVVDWQNNRVLEYYSPLTTDLIADRVFGQQNSFTTGTYTTTPTADTLTNPMSVAVDSSYHVYIADRGSYRVLEYDPPNSNTTANRVFGQFGSFTTKNYNSGGVSANSLSAPLGIGVDTAGNLYVTDQDNSRALMYKTPITTDTTADVVFGQLGSFTSSGADINGVSADSLETPTDIAADGAGNVYITDTGTERTLEYDNPAALGTTADVVFGMAGNFTNYGNNFGGLSADSQADPWALAFDPNCNVWMVDYGNNRVLEYDKPPHACVDAPVPSPTPSPAPTAPVLTTGPGTTTLSFNGGLGHNFGVAITFGTINAAGNTTVATSKAPPPVPLPPGAEVMGFHEDGLAGLLEAVQPVYYDISTTASLSGLQTVCLQYDGSQVLPGNYVHLMHSNGGAWDDITSSDNPAHHVICGQTPHFSPFAITQSPNPPSAVGGVAVLKISPVGSGGVADFFVWIAVAFAALLASGGGVAYARRRR